MNLKKILVGLDEIKAKGEIDREVTSIENDSRKVIEGSMFFAIKGFSTDGTKYIQSAIENGAKVILIDEQTDFKSLQIPQDVTLVVVKDRFNHEEIETGLKKMGAMLGDYVEVGCNSVLNPGTVIGRNSNIYPLSRVRGVVPENSIFKELNDIVEKK